jgi:hypothetical protein
MKCEESNKKQTYLKIQWSWFWVCKRKRENMNEFGLGLPLPWAYMAIGCMVRVDGTGTSRPYWVPPLEDQGRSESVHSARARGTCVVPHTGSRYSLCINSKNCNFSTKLVRAASTSGYSHADGHYSRNTLRRNFPISIFWPRSGTGAWYETVPPYRWSLFPLEPAKFDIFFHLCTRLCTST